MYHMDMQKCCRFLGELGEGIWPISKYKNPIFMSLLAILRVMREQLEG